MLDKEIKETPEATGCVLVVRNHMVIKNRIGAVTRTKGKSDGYYLMPGTGIAFYQPELESAFGPGVESAFGTKVDRKTSRSGDFITKLKTAVFKTEDSLETIGKIIPAQVVMLVYVDPKTGSVSFGNFNTKFTVDRTEPFRQCWGKGLYGDEYWFFWGEDRTSANKLFQEKLIENESEQTVEQFLSSTMIIDRTTPSTLVDNYNNLQ